MANTKYDKLEKNLPIQYTELNKLWIYEGSNELDFTPFAGKYLNRAGKSLLIDFIYLQKVVQINKGILSALEGNFVEYNPTNIYEEGDVVLYKDTFYISLDDNNNRSLNDSNMWYPFKLQISQFFMKDSVDNNIYKITLQNGNLITEKVE